ncbi:MAG: helix-turn-helix transcriptional regulator [Micrococcales bacterium]|nr:helix-turn-helix transcriptional regulator [Micrococcales bacterium]
MARSLEEMLAERPVDRDAVEAHKRRMLDEVRTYRLRELRRNAPSGALTQEDLARMLDVSQARVSRLERGDLTHTQIGTLRRYAEALGGQLVVQIQTADTSYRIA